MNAAANGLRPEELRAAVLSLLDFAMHAGATAADAVLVQQSALSVAVRLGDVEKLTEAREKRVGLPTVRIDGLTVGGTQA